MMTPATQASRPQNIRPEITFSAWSVPGSPPEFGLIDTFAKTLRTPTTNDSMPHSFVPALGGQRTICVLFNGLGRQTPPRRWAPRLRSTDPDCSVLDAR